MRIFTGYSANLPTQLWIAARYIESISILAAPLFIGRRIKAYPVLFAYFTAFSLLLISIFYWNIFPICFIEGEGLTPFKIISEYIISVILLASIAVLFKKRSEFDRNVFVLLTASIVTTIASELFFTFYIHVYGLSNLIGHFLKIVSFYLIYRAVIVISLMNPYKLMFRNLKQSEEQLELIIDIIPGLLAYAGSDQRYLYVNKAYADWYGLDKQEIVGKRISDVLNEESYNGAVRHIDAVLKGEELSYENIGYDTEGRLHTFRASFVPHLDEQKNVQAFVGLVEDITERKLAEEPN